MCVRESLLQPHGLVCEYMTFSTRGSERGFEVDSRYGLKVHREQCRSLKAQLKSVQFRLGYGDITSGDLIPRPAVASYIPVMIYMVLRAVGVGFDTVIASPPGAHASIFSGALRTKCTQYIPPYHMPTAFARLAPMQCEQPFPPALRCLNHSKTGHPLQRQFLPARRQAVAGTEAQC